jgi:uncharacterized protein (DUF2062 family)
MRNLFKRLTPDRDKIEANRWLRPVAHWLRRPDIWHFNRRTVARGFALGLFVGLLLPIGQILLAAVLAGIARSNILVAALATLVSNPLTFPAIYYIAWRLGGMLPITMAERLGENAGPIAAASVQTASGLAVMAVVGAILGFLAVHLAWRVYLLWHWRARQRRGARRLDSDA